MIKSKTKVFLLLAFSLFCQLGSSQNILQDLDKGLEEARAKDRPVMLFFTGSDWCKPCILMKKEVIHSVEFEKYATDHLVLVNLDFPFRKVNQLSEEQQAHNEAMADLYNPKGIFPYVLILDQEGKRIAEIEYSKNLSPHSFIQSIKELQNHATIQIEP